MERGISPMLTVTRPNMECLRHSRLKSKPLNSSLCSRSALSEQGSASDVSVQTTESLPLSDSFSNIAFKMGSLLRQLCPTTQNRIGTHRGTAMLSGPRPKLHSILHAPQ